MCVSQTQAQCSTVDRILTEQSRLKIVNDGTRSEVGLGHRERVPVLKKQNDKPSVFLIILRHAYMIVNFAKALQCLKNETIVACPLFRTNMNKKFLNVKDIQKRVLEYMKKACEERKGICFMVFVLFIDNDFLCNVDGV
jgi:hypothetical protein